MQASDNSHTATKGAVLRQSLRVIHPKRSSEDTQLLSRVHLSKHWKLPPRASRSMATLTTTTVTTQGPVQCTGLESKRQVQNREAQRAYRERRAHRLQELEDTVEQLQNRLRKLSQQCDRQERRCQDLTAENESLTREVGALKRERDMRSLKPVLLRKRRSQHRANFSKPTSVPKVVARRIFEETTCGFCNESTSCICSELEHSTTGTNTGPVASLNGSSCSTKPDTCEKCTDIENSCIVPLARDVAPLAQEKIDFTNYKS
ncbi:Yap5p KNAG_0D04590 [Huiozyma naganishii CBS 8797]|uniref:BZIP domain-containing protein n=1 Tax=Huiozyma naganishii (strain ATCC MYA-139 / BCRC 22969 / CBS 8797 / KCTC 17520 / NBRC 10181 / NCYC 3082 / Yp74L-3) TaxID=1071383 RepID=J7S649_HUIN7|nr:hypothetical protein KNAG_0D04590 [Kazachstania naganishii CBS 8797]CCK70204.1 hypothetical protein KNAG_0D04590 [Kazachstania naganishii CBS 8797]